MKVELLKFMKPFVGLHASCVAQQEDFFLISAFNNIRIFFWLGSFVTDWHL